MRRAGRVRTASQSETLATDSAPLSPHRSQIHIPVQFCLVPFLSHVLPNQTYNPNTSQGLMLEDRDTSHRERGPWPELCSGEARARGAAHRDHPQGSGRAWTQVSVVG